MVSVIVNGASGRMGQEAVKAIEADAQLQLVAALGSHDNLADTIVRTKAQVVVDFTTPASVYKNTLTIMQNKAHPVIGTTGLTATQITDLQTRAKSNKIGGIIAPNFSIGAILMMRFSTIAAKFMQDAEIIELHHPHKLDAPSGTSIKTAEMIQAAQKHDNKKPTNLIARGDQSHGINIHSVRLPGLVAHQEVIFGGNNETLRIKHDSLHRQSFMPGVCLACKTAPTLSELHYGLEHILDLN